MTGPEAVVAALRELASSPGEQRAEGVLTALQALSFDGQSSEGVVTALRDYASRGLTS